ncbi:glyceraldehyde-3-phosphate dehydrogenase [Bdellovibrio sp. ZAP7]|uniref:BamA/TamA family outer membrane protein n=1 Tax=Bdellovibrio sp. ZAP7 TaxID=2231053 RepID=UPI00115A6D33|nr:BamA/TamA family outer membrane protein [Bdellovibrio sp. ZAP7]QDK44242.1 glyceraldehyde-3-phosphate dehydrogenase [Bdellovibrio sp. ZAP7]
MKNVFMALCASIAMSVGNAMASTSSIFFDPEDHYLDASEWLLKHRGFLPVPIIITEPAVGTGGGVALLFMSDSDGAREARASEAHKRFIPPTVTGVLAAGTDNGTRLGGAFYVTNWNRDRWRYLGFVMAASANLDFYGLGGFNSADDIHLQYNLKGGGIYNDLRARIDDSNFFIGGRYIYTDISVDFKTGALPPVLQGEGVDNRNGGISVLLSYDSRNNTMSPQQGLLAEYRYYIFSENLGGDLDYHVQALDLQGFTRASEQWGFAGRWISRWADSDAPFYAKPFINLRGIPKLRYQGDIASSLEGEVRYNPHPRWELSIFGGAGRATDSLSNMNNADTASAYGAGFRYMMARLLGFQMGADIARGPEETVFYIQAGGAWGF